MSHTRAKRICCSTKKKSRVKKKGWDVGCMGEKMERRGVWNGLKSNEHFLQKYLS